MPVALNRNKIKEAKTPAGDLYRDIQKQRTQYQGVWIVSPEGKVLSQFQDARDPKNQTVELRLPSRRG